jgi:hypothetical protein
MLEPVITVDKIPVTYSTLHQAIQGSKRRISLSKEVENFCQQPFHGLTSKAIKEFRKPWVTYWQKLSSH